MAKKLNFKDKMLKEINEQPEILKRILKKYINNKGEIIIPELKPAAKDLKKIKRFTFLGCGTSYHAAMYGNYVFEEIAGIPCEFEMAEEFNARRTVIEKKTGILILSQSGETSDSMTAAYKTKGKGAFLIALTNNPNSNLAKLADSTINLSAGEEKAVAATKTYTSELAMLLLVALFIRQHKRPLSLKIKKIISELDKLPRKQQIIVNSSGYIGRMLKIFKRVQYISVLGQKYNYPTALEAALKLKEATYTKAEGIEANEFRHGPQALVQPHFLSVYIAPDSTSLKTDVKIIEKIRELKGGVIAVTNFGNKRIRKLANDTITVPKTLEILYPFLTVIALQLLAYKLAVAKGIKVDKPKNISKFVIN